MFHLGRDDVPLGGVGLKRRGDGGVVALRRTRSKNHVPRGRSNQLRHLFAGRFDDRLEFRAEFVCARWIAPFRREVRHHRFQNFGQNRRRRDVFPSEADVKRGFPRRA